MSDQADLGGESNSVITEQEESMNIIVKTSKERESFQIAVNADVKKLRELVSERYQIEPSKVCLIFSGKILKDGDLLQNHKMKDGHIVHLVIRDVNKLSSTGESSTQSRPTVTSSSTTSSTTTSQSASSSNTTSSSASNPLSSMFGSLFGQNTSGAGAGAGAGGAGLDELNQQFAQQLNNPEFMRQMLDNPLMQNIYSNPDIFRSIITSNPQFQNLIERNPELNHVLSNPEILRQTFDMMRNPAAFQELMRSHDRALSNLESLPGGYNALRRMYTEFQEPMLNAAQEQFGANSFASSNSASSTTTTAPSNTENREPLPNPWDRSANATNNNSSQPSNASSNSTTNPTGSPFNMFSSGAMQSAMEQFAANPSMVQNLMNSPLMQQMVQTLSNDPNLTSQLMSQAPVPGAALPNASALQSMLSTFSNSLPNNSVFQRIMTDPQAVQALIQIQNGVEQLERILGVRVDNLNINELLRNYQAQGNSSTSNATSTNTSAAVTSASSAQTTTTPSVQSGGTQPSSTASNPAPNTPNVNAASLTQMMQQMFNVSQPPEVRFQQQLTQLEQMGFTNREANVRALVETFGNVEAAIDRLLMRM